MRTSDETNELTKALAESQAEFAKITKSKTAEVTMKTGGKYSYSYADLADVIDAVRPVLAKHQIATMQAIDLDSDTGNLVLITRLGHASGQWIEAHYPLPSGASAQEMGSAVTYARRYSLSALTAIVAEDDDDGRQAPKATPKSRPQQSAPKQTRQDKPPTPAPATNGNEASVDRQALLDAIRKASPDHPRVKDGSITAMSPRQLDALAHSIPGLTVDSPAGHPDPAGESPDSGIPPEGPHDGHWEALAHKVGMWPAELLTLLHTTPEGKSIKSLGTLDPESEMGRKLETALTPKVRESA